MNIDDILQSLPSREDITHALSRYNTTSSNWMGSSRSDTDLLPALGIFGTGMLLGAGLAILFAPKSGTEIRRDIADRMGELGGHARDMAEQGRQMASDMGEQARQMAGQYGGSEQGQSQQSRGQQGHGQMSQSTGSTHSGSTASQSTGGLGGSQQGSSQHGSTSHGGTSQSQGGSGGFNRTR